MRGESGAVFRSFSVRRQVPKRLSCDSKRAGTAGVSLLGHHYKTAPERTSPASSRGGRRPARLLSPPTPGARLCKLLRGHQTER